MAQENPDRAIDLLLRFIEESIPTKRFMHVKQRMRKPKSNLIQILIYQS